MLCTILSEETALVGGFVYKIGCTETVWSRSYGTIRVEPEVECAQRVNDYIASVTCCQVISKKNQGKTVFYLHNYLESKK